jgi:hypothetical protein
LGRFSRRNLDVDTTTNDLENEGKCSRVLYFGNRLLYSRCKSRVGDVLKKRMAMHAGNRQLMMSDVCRCIDNLMKCGDKILSHCLKRRSVDDVNDAILFNMKKVFEKYKHKTGFDSGACDVFSDRQDLDLYDDDDYYLEYYDESNLISTRRSDKDANYVLIDTDKHRAKKLPRTSSAIQTMPKIALAFVSVVFSILAQTSLAS